MTEIKSVFTHAANILSYEKQNFSKLSEAQIKTQEDLLKKNTEEFTEKLFYLNKVFTAQNSK